VWSNIDPQLISDQSTPLSDVKLVAGPRLKEPRGEEGGVDQVSSGVSGRGTERSGYFQKFILAICVLSHVPNPTDYMHCDD
jgi:hypothetical protein